MGNGPNDVREGTTVVTVTVHRVTRLRGSDRASFCPSSCFVRAYFIHQVLEALDPSLKSRYEAELRSTFLGKLLPFLEMRRHQWISSVESKTWSS